MHDFLDAANPILRGTTPIERTDYTTEAFASEAAAFIGKNQGAPWLCYLPFNAVHAPLQSTERSLARFKHVADEKHRTFCAMLSAMDDAVGTVLASIRQHGLEENTLIFFFSDNGGPTAFADAVERLPAPLAAEMRVDAPVDQHAVVAVAEERDALGGFEVGLHLVTLESPHI